MKTILILAFAFLSTIPFAKAYEVDNFSERDLKKDSLVAMDQEINRLMARAVFETHKEVGNQCKFSMLRQEILRWVRPDPIGQFEIWLEISKDIERTKSGFAQSMYKDLNVGDSPIMAIMGIGRSVLLNGHIVGADKVGHFFFQGLEYYDLVKEGKDLDKVLLEDHGEDGIWGLGTSGVKSYADMAANYQGYLFWRHLTMGDAPYVRCDSKLGWVINKKFTWSTYVTAAWDEGINCSEMKAPIQAKVDHYLKEKNLQCPLDLNECIKITQMDHAQFFVSPQCVQAARSLNTKAPKYSQIKR